MIGTVIRQRYQIIQNLGSGGFGQTFLARDLQLPDHPQCVVKRLKPATSDESVLQIASRLFETEARVLHKLGNHDRIPRLLAHFEEAQEFYLVQELIDGYDLTNELIAKERSVDGYPIGRMNEMQVIAFLLDVLEILGFVHAQGAIHRDIKPANLMRRRSDGKLVLIDFGAVKQLGTNSASASTVAIGTNGYMPNEQAIGKPRPCSDLYAVGAIAIQGLTGVPPSLISEDMQTGELYWRQSPTNASTKYRTQVSDDLARVIDKLVKYDFRDRYQSAEAALTDLRQLYIPVAPTLLPNYAQANTSNQDLTAINQLDQHNSTTFVPSVQWKSQDKKWLKLTVIAVLTTIAATSAVLFLRLTPSHNNDINKYVNKNDSNTIASSPSPTPSPKYVFLSERAVTDSDLADKSTFELDIMLNEIFARYGRRFQDPELQSYFLSQPWYKPKFDPNQFPEDILTSLEIKNVTYIRNFQARFANNSNLSKPSNNNLQEAKCDSSKRLVSDPNPPINVRKDAGTDYEIVGTLNNDREITVISEKQGWLKISEPIKGWVAANRTKPKCL
ncbi:MAG: YARHG domain-containing protein [Pseudanabaena sp. M007S1SP1A06QC]|nr:YARHG domain-containing protein [Pseudanabaena sp. M007S1SP1A06QC]